VWDVKLAKWRELINYFLWVAGLQVVFLLMSWAFDFPDVNAFAVFVLASSFFLFIANPFTRRGFPQSLELGIAVSLVAIFFIYFGTAIIAPRIERDAQEGTICSPQSLEIRCYRLSSSDCHSIWDHYRSECEAEIKSKQVRPTQLLGSGIKRCVRLRFDKYMSFNQRNEDLPICRAYFKDLKGARSPNN
jgi:hypothetical protein